MCTDAPLIPAEYRELLPPQCLPSLERRLRAMPQDLRPDALQEAVLAHLNGKSPCNAIRSLVRSEARHARREVPHTQLTPRNSANPG